MVLLTDTHLTLATLPETIADPMPKITARKGRTVQITVRVDESIVTRADKLIDQIARLTGRGTTRADVLREAILVGLNDFEMRHRR